MIVFSYICLVVFLIVSFFSFIIVLDQIEKKRISKKIENFTTYIAVLEYHMKKAYDIIYKDRILIYSIEAVKINDSDFNVVTKDYALLVLKMIGQNLKNEFVELYGNEETLIFNLVEYFNNQFENDEIREKAKQNIFDEMEKS